MAYKYKNEIWPNINVHTKYYSSDMEREIKEVYEKAEKYNTFVEETEQHLKDLKTIKENHGWPFLDREIDTYTIILNRLKGDE